MKKEETIKMTAFEIELVAADDTFDVLEIEAEDWREALEIAFGDSCLGDKTSKPAIESKFLYTLLGYKDGLSLAVPAHYLKEIIIYDEDHKIIFHKRRPIENCLREY